MDKYIRKSISRILMIVAGALYMSGSVNAQDWQKDLKEFREAYKKEISGVFPEVEQEFYGVDSTYNLIATYKIIKGKKIYEFNTSSNMVKTFKKYAEIKMLLNGKEIVFFAYQSVPIMKMYRNHIFLPFKDLTSTKTTYGAGRYLDLDLRDFKNGELKIDFNKAYNPYCAFSDGYSCPIPPKENNLGVEIMAGEKIPKGH